MAALPSANLPPAIKEKAKNELNEKDENLAGHLESLQHWVQSQPHLKYPTDKNLLLPFLRHAKYCRDKAQARLDNFCTLRTSELNGAPQWFDYPPVNDPIVNNYLKAGMIVELGRTKDNVSMLLIRFGAWDVATFPYNLSRMMLFMDTDRLISDPISQVAGFGIVNDLTGFGPPHLTQSGTGKDMKLEMQFWQECSPLRTKHVIYYNEPPMVDFIFKLSDAWLSDEIKPRILRVKDKIDEAYDQVPGLKDIMPEEYGGKNGKLDDLIAKHAHRFREYYSKPSPWVGIQVDEPLRPNSAKNYLKEYQDINFEMFGAVETALGINNFGHTNNGYGSKLPPLPPCTRCNNWLIPVVHHVDNRFMTPTNEISPPRRYQTKLGDAQERFRAGTDSSTLCTLYQKNKAISSHILRLSKRVNCSRVISTMLLGKLRGCLI